MPKAKHAGVGIGNSVMAPYGVMRPILLPPFSVNRRLPSGPVVMPYGPPLFGIGNSVMAPAGVILPTLPPSTSTNHTLPSGPAAMPKGTAKTVGMGNSVMDPRVV